MIVVQGDTTTAMCAALSAFYARVPVAYVEAGLRSGRPDDPFPEELNRRIISQIAFWHFSPTPVAAANLHTEGIPATRIEVTGNTVVDSLHWILNQRRGTDRFRSTVEKCSSPSTAARTRATRCAA
ncbi:UDP-N-acetylglucosamine 2-epimerase [Geodermatophilus poikilotrophus]|uniref:UDP-N-acetylglucosamine 2-epimerase n=1 Tax=Geodermatophilus poikilotrophus TaxID=1333667 RepID=UPI003CCBC54E